MRQVIGLCCVIVVAVCLSCQNQEPGEPEMVLPEAQPEVHEEVAPVPEPAPTPAEQAVVEPPAPAETTYVVKSGDTLYSLAKRFYGDGKLSNVIYDANRDRIPHPRLMRVGTEIRIPPKPERDN